MYKCKYEGIGVFADRCIATRTAEACVGYEKCERYKPKYITNADRIRAMSDEELARFLESRCHRLLCDKKYFLEWLKQPAEEE